MLRKLAYASMLVILVLVCTQTTFAQTGFAKTQNVDATATVYSAITITNVTTVNFSNIAVNSNPTLDPIGVANSHVGTGFSAGGFQVNGSHGATILVTWPGTQGILSDGVTSSMKFTPAVSFGSPQGSSSGYTSGNHVALDGSGVGVFWVGGELFAAAGTGVVPSGQTAGSYSTANAGTPAGVPITFTIDYVL